jgi:hypothetical protein
MSPKPWTQLEIRKANKCAEFTNQLIKTELEVAAFGDSVIVLEEGMKFATVSTFGELDSLLAGMCCGERGGEKVSCYSFSQAEWEHFNKGYRRGQSLRKE